jgi:hypothetical protein
MGALEPGAAGSARISVRMEMHRFVFSPKNTALL